MYRKADTQRIDVLPELLPASGSGCSENVVCYDQAIEPPGDRSSSSDYLDRLLLHPAAVRIPLEQKLFGFLRTLRLIDFHPQGPQVSQSLGVALGIGAE